MLGIHSFYVPEDAAVDGGHDHEEVGTSKIVIPESSADGTYVDVGDGDFVIKREGGVTKVESAVEITAPGTSASHCADVYAKVWLRTA